MARPTARNGRCFVRRSRPGAQQEGWANQQIWMGHAAVTRADTHRVSQTFARGGVGQAGVEAKPFRAWIDAWEMRGLDAMQRRQHRAARTQSIGRRFQLRAAPRRRPAAGAAGRRRLQPEIAARTGLVLLQPAALYGEGQHHHRRQAGRRHRTWPGSIASGAASRWPSDQSGWDWLSLHFNAGDKADAVPDAPDRRPALRLGQVDRARRQDRTARLRRHHA